MNDQDDVRELLDTALRGEPPSTVDPTRLMKLGRRRLRLQRAGAALGVMVVAGGIALGAGLIHQGGNGAGPGLISAASPPSVPVIPAPTQPPETSPDPFSATPTVAVPPYLPSVLVAQNQALAAAYHLPSGMITTGGQLVLVASEPTDQGYAGSKLSAELADHTGFGQLSVNVVVAKGGFGGMSCDAGKTNCAVKVINGFSVEIETDHPTATTTRILTVASNAVGDVLVQGEVDNIAVTGKTPTRSTPPLTATQLAQVTVAIAAATK